jgi:alkylated DNA repair protein alkB family protein 6
MDLERFRVQELPDSVYYIPDIISLDEETLLLNRISKTPKTKWTQLRNRRLQNWGGMPHQKGMIPEEMPDWLEVCDQI